MRYIHYALYLALPLAALQSWQVLAHHAFSAEFDKDAPVTLEGKVTKIEWINPHAWIHLDVIGEDGEAVAWMSRAAHPIHCCAVVFIKTHCPSTAKLSFAATGPMTKPVNRPARPTAAILLSPMAARCSWVHRAPVRHVMAPTHETAERVHQQHVPKSDDLRFCCVAGYAQPQYSPA